MKRPGELAVAPTLPVECPVPDNWIDSVALVLDEQSNPVHVAVGITRPRGHPGNLGLHAWGHEYASELFALEDYPTELIGGRPSHIVRGLGSVIWQEADWVMGVRARKMSDARRLVERVAGGRWQLGWSPRIRTANLPVGVSRLSWNRDERAGWSAGFGFGPRDRSSFLGWYVRGTHIPDGQFAGPPVLTDYLEDDSGQYSVGSSGAQRRMGEFTAVLTCPDEFTNQERVTLLRSLAFDDEPAPLG